MSEPVARQRPMINLDEFERRLRQPAAAPSQRKEDPLAELARLVGSEHDPYQGVFEEPQQAQSQQRSLGDDYASSYPPAAYNMRQAPRPGVGAAPRQAGLQRRAPENWGVPGGPAAAPRQPSAPAPAGGGRDMRAEGPANGPMRGSAQRVSDTQNLGGNFAAIEAGLRGSIQPDYRTAPAQSYALDHHGQDHELPEDDDWFEEVQAAAPRPAAMVPSAADFEPTRPRRLLYVTAAIILVGMGGIGLTFALKRGTASPQQIAMIKAATSPAKVQAPATSDGANAAMQDASVLDKTPQPPPVGVVNRQEQPVALPQTAAPSGSNADAASVPVPTPPTEAPPWEGGPGNAQSAPQGPNQAPAAARGPAPGRAQVADAAPSQAFGLGGLIQSRKVKTVAVRPDGSVVADDAPLQMPPEAQGAAPAAPNQSAATAAPPPATSKPTARVATPKSADVAEEPAAPSGSGVAASSTASAKTKAGHAKPVKVADLGASNEAAAGPSGGDFAVQLAAPATEAEAHHAITRLMHAYQAELGGYPLKFHRAKVGDKSVYRVRVGGLSKTAAVKLCQSLQAKGGSCFVAKD